MVNATQDTRIYDLRKTAVRPLTSLLYVGLAAQELSNVAPSQPSCRA